MMRVWPNGMPSTGAKSKAHPKVIPLAVLGDSSSQSYHDTVWFPMQNGERGGAHRLQTFQWTEVLARLRGEEFDLGPWVQWGWPGPIARGREWLGLAGGRSPPKQDYLYNFANSGAACRNLMRGRFRQAPRLVALMNQTPEQWQRGVVVIRIGINDWSALIDLQARDPMAARLHATTAYCKGEIAAAMALIRASHPSTRILVVGIGNEADDPSNLESYQTEVQTRNLRAAVANFNDALRNLVRGDPRLAYFDDFGWFERLWGSRTADGKPAFRAVEIGTTLRVTYTAGDDPRNALLKDLHPGLAWNTLWAQSLVQRLNEVFGLGVTPISDEEVERFLAPLVEQPKARTS
ncbi:hypothetical protein WDL1P2_00369 (plasmid) [Variovorax sp. WDL1]|nr:hypothetical protein CHC06_06471 [Variovorax sp. B2]PNG49619.1 hypothetical protein CHC07_06528 [Variovorax sp. B4]VTV18708.1 hypothetical protein WDL1P2_00369 [Variovorax sp. WDL1]